VKANKRYRDGAWRLTVAAGSDPLTGRRRTVYKTVHAPDNRAGAKQADAEHQQRCNHGARYQSPKPGRPGVEQLHSRSDGDQIGGNVEAVGHDEGDKEDGKDCSAKPIEPFDGQLPKTGPGRQGGAITDLLHRGH